MFSSTFKRSAATLGVVAGLLAAAAPASAQSLPGMIGVTAPQTGPKASANALIDAKVPLELGLKAGASAEPAKIYDHGITQADDRPTESVSFLESDGTHVGSEGLKTGRTILIDLDATVTVKAPKPSDTRGATDWMLILDGVTAPAPTDATQVGSEA